MFKHFQDWINRNRAKKCKKALSRAYTDYMISKAIFEGEESSIQGDYNKSAYASTSWDPKTAEEILDDWKHAVYMMSRRAWK